MGLVILVVGGVLGASLFGVMVHSVQRLRGISIGERIDSPGTSVMGLSPRGCMFSIRAITRGA